MNGEELEWIDEELPDAAGDAIEPRGGESLKVVTGAETKEAIDPARLAVKAWRSGWASPWARPATKPNPPPSILKRGGEPAGPFRGAAGILAGAGAVGKSWAALDLAVKVAAGPDAGAAQWCGFEVAEHGRVVYVAAEDPGEVLDGRLFDLSSKLTDLQRARLRERLHVAALADASPELLRVWRINRQMEPDEAKAAGVNAVITADDTGAAVRLRSPSLGETRIMASELMAAMREDLKGAGVVLVVLDPLARLGGSDAEGDNAVAARLMRELGGLAVDAGAAVLVVHHTTKAARKPGEASNGTGIRGASGLVDGSRWAAELTETDAGLMLTVVKASYSRVAMPVHLRREDWGGLREETAAERAERLKKLEAARAVKPKASPSGGGTSGADRAAGGRDSVDEA